MNIRQKHYNDGYGVYEPLNDLNKSMGYLMVCTPSRKILRFYRLDAVNEAIEYCDYKALSRYEKLKYWLRYKRDKR